MAALLYMFSLKLAKIDYAKIMNICTGTYIDNIKEVIISKGVNKILSR